MLGAVGLQVVVEEVRVHAVSSDILELEVEVIVEAVASHAGLVAVELVLVHLLKILAIHPFKLGIVKYGR